MRLPARTTLYKAFNADLQTDAPAAFAFLSAMSYTNDDQNSIALDINNGMTPEEAAQKWIDANPRRLAAVGRRGARRAGLTTEIERARTHSGAARRAAPDALVEA